MTFKQPILLAAAVVALALPSAHGSVGSPGDCAWPVRSNADRGNVAYPDSSAQYWISSFAGAPGTHLEIRGTFPRARYMSFHIYEGGVPIDKLTDFQLVPVTGRNPFRKGADRRRRGTYRVRVVSDAPPKDPHRRAPNTLYAGRGVATGEPVPAATIIYRVYLGQGDETGGVGLPAVSETVDGQNGETTLPACPPHQASQNAGLNAAIAGESVPTDWPAGPLRAAPTWGVARSGGATNPFFPNFDNTYLSLAVTRDQGSVLAFRAKAPAFTRSRGARRFRAGQLRYWSFCTNDQYTTRFIGCVADQDAKIDSKGYVTVVVSDVAHRPRALDRGDNWLPWGPSPDVFVLYRHMLPAPGFTHAVQRVPARGDPAKTMGAYYPHTVICDTAGFERDSRGLPQPSGPRSRTRSRSAAAGA